MGGGRDAKGMTRKYSFALSLLCTSVYAIRSPTLPSDSVPHPFLGRRWLSLLQVREMCLPRGCQWRFPATAVNVPLCLTRALCRRVATVAGNQLWKVVFAGGIWRARPQAKSHVPLRASRRMLTIRQDEGHIPKNLDRVFTIFEFSIREK